MNLVRYQLHVNLLFFPKMLNKFIKIVLIINHSTGKYWQNYHLAHIDVVNLHSGNALKVHNRERDYAGAFSDFFIDKDCFEEKQRFLFVGKDLSLLLLPIFEFLSSIA